MSPSHEADPEISSEISRQRLLGDGQQTNTFIPHVHRDSYHSSAVIVPPQCRRGGECASLERALTSEIHPADLLPVLLWTFSPCVCLISQSYATWLCVIYCKTAACIQTRSSVVALPRSAHLASAPLSSFSVSPRSAFHLLCAPLFCSVRACPPLTQMRASLRSAHAPGASAANPIRIEKDEQVKKDPFAFGVDEEEEEHKETTTRRSGSKGSATASGSSRGSLLLSASKSRASTSESTKAAASSPAKAAASSSSSSFTARGSLLLSASKGRGAGSETTKAAAASPTKASTSATASANSPARSSMLLHTPSKAPPAAASASAAAASSQRPSSHRGPSSIADRALVAAAERATAKKIQDEIARGEILKSSRSGRGNNDAGGSPVKSRAGKSFIPASAVKALAATATAPVAGSKRRRGGESWDYHSDDDEEAESKPAARRSLIAVLKSPVKQARPVSAADQPKPRGKPGPKSGSKRRRAESPDPASSSSSEEASGSESEAASSSSEEEEEEKQPSKRKRGGSSRKSGESASAAFQSASSKKSSSGRSRSSASAMVDASESSPSKKPRGSGGRGPSTPKRPRTILDEEEVQEEKDDVCTICHDGGFLMGQSHSFCLLKRAAPLAYFPLMVSVSEVCGCLLLILLCVRLSVFVSPVCDQCVHAFHTGCLNDHHESNYEFLKEHQDADSLCCRDVHLTCTQRKEVMHVARADLDAEPEDPADKRMAVKWVGPLKRQGGRKYFRAFTRGPHRFELGSYVTLLNGVSAAGQRDFLVGEIESLFEDLSTHLQMVEIRWLYLPEETHTGRLPSHHPQEVFSTAHTDINEIECISDLCEVVDETEFQRRAEEDKMMGVTEALRAKAQQVFMLRQRYDHDGAGRFLPLIHGPGGIQRAGAAARERAVNPRLALATQARPKSSKAHQSIYSQACAQLQLSAAPPKLPCRDKEKRIIEKFLVDGIQRGTSNGGLYIAGVPGTGQCASKFRFHLLLSFSSFSCVCLR